MVKILSLEISIDIENRNVSTRVGYNKDEFFEDDFKLIEVVGKDFCQMVGMAYMHKLEKGKEVA